MGLDSGNTLQPVVEPLISRLGVVDIPEFLREQRILQGGLKENLLAVLVLLEYVGHALYPDWLAPLGEHLKAETVHGADEGPLPLFAEIRQPLPHLVSGLVGEG